ncbi:MAG: nucleotide-binding protein [Clostridiales bacterium]|jgi:hypothetical protein|nr:nucleotide-binding protein [Clostridiales bacterium]
MSKISQMKNIIYELEQLYVKVQSHNDQVKSNGYIYAVAYREWVDEYNVIIEKYNALTLANLSMTKVAEHNLSSTHKTVRPETVNTFLKAIKTFSSKIETEITSEQNHMTSYDQMRVCFKTKIKGCTLNPTEKKERFFIAMPFNDDYRDSFVFGIKVALEQSGTDYYMAEEEIKNKDMMCKICEQLQSCGKMIANISGLNPNVILELGIAYGLGKDVFVIKDKKTNSISDLNGIEYTEYSNASDLQKKLFTMLSD